MFHQASPDERVSHGTIDDLPTTIFILCPVLGCNSIITKHILAKSYGRIATASNLPESEPIDVQESDFGSTGFGRMSTSA